MKQFLRSLIAPTVVALIVAGVANGAVYQWSHTAGSNATADATINWAEGMSPSSVNDSARAMMARTADWRDDFSGLLATAGTSTAYTVTTNQGFPSTPTTGQLVSITPHTTNGASSTLAADGGTAFPIQTAPGTAVAAGVLISGTPYDLKFSGTAWILKHFFGNPFNVPLGAVLDYTGTTAPNSNFVLANGQCISRTTYAAYFALVSTTFGVCDGSTTFGVPDLSNRVVAGLQMAGTARITVAGGNFDGNTLGASGGAQNQTLTTAQMPAHTHTGTTAVESAHFHTGVTDPGGSFTPSGTNSTSSVTINNQPSGTWIVQAGGTQINGAGSGMQIATLTGTAAAQTFTGNPVANHQHSFGTTGNSGHLHTFTSDSTGSSASHPIMPPAMVLSKIVRIF